MTSNPRMVDLSGYSFSGKSAVYDLLVRYSGVTGHDLEFEFDLVRCRGGVLDLYDSLTQRWNLVRSSVAVRDFKRVAYFLGGDTGLVDRLLRGGPRYGCYFSEFDRIMEDYVGELTIDSWSCYWPFMDYPEARVFAVVNKLLGKIWRHESVVCLARWDESEFVGTTRRAMDRLIVNGLKGSAEVLLLNNCCDPSDPGPTLRLFSNAVSIVVDRDPRDIYLSALNASNPEVGRAAIGGGIDSFISRFKVLRASSASDSSLVLRISFEDLVLNFENTKRLIVEHVGAELVGTEDPLCAGFDPVRSSENVGQWRSNSVYNRHRAEIIKIEKELGSYLTPYT